MINKFLILLLIIAISLGLIFTYIIFYNSPPKIDPDIANDLRLFNKGVLTSSVLHLEFSGQIKSINLGPNNLQFTITGTDQEESTFNFSGNETKLIKVTNNLKTSSDFTLKNLKKGDNIDIVTEVRFVPSNSHDYINYININKK